MIKNVRVCCALSWSDWWNGFCVHFNIFYTSTKPNNGIFSSIRRIVCVCVCAPVCMCYVYVCAVCIVLNVFAPAEHIPGYLPMRIHSRTTALINVNSELCAKSDNIF